MGIKDVLNSSHVEEEPDERLSVTNGPGMPDEELPNPSSENWKKEYLKRGAGIFGAAGTLYTGYELGINTGHMELDDFFDFVEPSVEEVLEGAAETGADAAMSYGPEAASYAAELSNGLL